MQQCTDKHTSGFKPLFGMVTETDSVLFLKYCVTESPGTEKRQTCSSQSHYSNLSNDAAVKWLVR
jgi:hypothetical protein